ncbi:hypothetical protein [Microbacterium sp. NPDC076911]|uniref:hypothetical protein n=1 Tax=Microbacterium sp. NPDC076911 TaxID=3154958 RepID=UPI0034262BC6
MTDDKLAENSDVEALDHTDAAAKSTVDEVEAATTPEHAPEHAPQYGVGPFSIREVALIGVWVAAVIVSFFSISTLRFDSVWTSGLQWILTIGVPTAAVFLVVLRRLSPLGIRRVGSLGIDQFASVAFSVSSVLWAQSIWETVAFAGSTGQWVRTWVIWVSFFLMMAGVFLTVFAPFISPIDEDFVGREEVPAHRNARPIRAISPRPAPVAAAVDPASVEDSDKATEPVDADSEIAADDSVTGAYTAEEIAIVDAGESGEDAAVELTDADADGDGAPVAEPVRQQAFWALAPEERDVVDELGAPLFRVGPTAWALVIEDRGASFVVRHEDGRTGVLNDVSGVTRG